MAQRTVTLQLNTASLPDTTNTDSEFHVRGCLEGCMDNFSDLPDGNILAWGDTTTLSLTNAGGDFWNISFDVPDDTTMDFKFFSAQAEAGGVGGWEDGDNHQLAPGTGDTTLTLHFFEKGDDQDYDWRPFESKEDSVGIWFRVYMNTESAVNSGYLRDADSLFVGVRGDGFGGSGPLDWGATLNLAPESDGEADLAYDLFSGVAYYPDSLIGSTQPYKFVYQSMGLAVGWEGGIPDRTFTIPANDSTLHWVLFDESPAIDKSEERVTSTIIFTVDTTPLEAIGLYSRARGDSLEVRGEFNGWNCDDPTICELERVPGEDLFEGAFSITANAEATFNYKFFINHNDENFVSEFGEDPPSGWEEPISTTGSDRSFTFAGTQEQDLGIQFFNDVLPGNIIEEGNDVELTFQVRMDSALVDDASPFDPATDTVTVNLHGDALWAFSQGLFRDAQGGYQVSTSNIILTDEDGDGLYTGSIAVSGPTFSSVQYQYAFGGEGGTFSEEMGAGLGGGEGRRRTRFIVPNTDGSWPTEFSFPEEQYQPQGALPFEQNPASGVSIEQISDELPNKITLEANYPNPFNPTTTIEYSLTNTEQVALKVYDLTGRLVSTVLDGVQPSGTYKVTFDAAGLASGMYLYRLESASTTITRKMVLLK